LAYRIIPIFEHRILILHVSGLLTDADVVSALEDPAFDARATAVFDALMLCDPDTDFSAMTAQVARRIIEVDSQAFALDDPQAPPPKMAAVCPTEGVRVAIRLLLGVADQVAQGQEDRRDFTKVSDALKWLDRDTEAFRAKLRGLGIVV
jgi:hypothetical protein